MSYVVASVLALLAIFGHGSSWAYPGVYAGAWLGQTALLLLCFYVPRKRAWLWSGVVGGVGLAWAFHWAPGALSLCFDAGDHLARNIYFVLVLWHAVQFAFFGALAARGASDPRHAWWSIPAAWCVTEHYWPKIFPWLLGYTQFEFKSLIQIAEYTGSCGIGFVMTAACLAVAALLPRNRADGSLEPIMWRNVLVGPLMLFAVIVWGNSREKHWETVAAAAPQVRAALCQVDIRIQGSEEKLRKFTIEKGDVVDLAIWPESALGSYEETLQRFDDPAATRKASRLADDSQRPTRECRVDVLAGCRTYAPGALEEGPYRMTALLIDPGERIIARYHKRTLLPFGEYMPLQERFPQLREWATLQEVIEPGHDEQPLRTTPGAKIGVVICYEDLLRSNVRQSVRAGAEAIVSIINDSRFEDPLALEQHRRLSIMRAVENRRTLARCASTGTTCVVSPAGNLVKELPITDDAVLITSIPRIEYQTIYTRWGEWFPLFCLALIIGAAVRRRFRGGPANEMSDS